MAEVVDTPTGYPFMQVFYNSTGSLAGATAMSSVIISMVVMSNLATVATGSRYVSPCFLNARVWHLKLTTRANRQLYAFARDGALPFGPWLAHVSPTWNLPFNSVLVTFVSTSLLSLVNIGSATALNSITSLATNAYLTSYMVSIGCLIWRRWSGSPLLPSKFDLGRWGLPVYFAAEIFLACSFILCFFPMYNNPDAETMNYNIAFYGGVVALSTVYYFLYARFRYEGPVEYVQKLE